MAHATETTAHYRLTDGRFGMAGVYEAPSIHHLANEFMGTAGLDWANEEYQKYLAEGGEMTDDGLHTICSRIRSEFIDAVEEVQTRYYRADDDGEYEDFEAYSMEEAIAIARESWESATEGTYEVTVYEYLTEGGREGSGSSFYNANAYQTITVVAR